MTNFISSDSKVSIYSILGSPDQLEIDNAVLDLNGGEARIGLERYDCDSN
jgi:hypothetical protein